MCCTVPIAARKSSEPKTIVQSLTKWVWFVAKWAISGRLRRPDGDSVIMWRGKGEREEGWWCERQRSSCVCVCVCVCVCACVCVKRERERERERERVCVCVREREREREREKERERK